jgi:hypothetical protein
MQGVGAALVDVCVWYVAKVWFGRRAAKWTLALHLTNWFTFYALVS